MTDADTPFQLLANRVALVTGASRGIGAQTARVLAACGASVLLTARTLPQIEAVAADIRAKGGRAEAMACDVAVWTDVERAAAYARDTLGGLDIVVNNAGLIDPITHIADSDPAEWGQVFDVNAKGVYHGMRAALPIMIAAGGGTIITISSGAAHQPLEGWSHYCASKAAAAMLTRAVHLEAHGAGIRAIGLSPGTVATYMQEAIRESRMNPVSALDWSAHIPADWPARAVAWLCGPAGDEFAGTEVSLRDNEIRTRIGLSA
ncbi:MAG: NAD(P)-dependent dehydrogenase (short-subunit alcohol dehydrogenase family) [Paracoccaceae bacterium]|jgi:NAD(P)-dependent dehydrogenase (short-subunit alcohol dehydrogenase family)